MGSSVRPGWADPEGGSLSPCAELPGEEPAQTLPEGGQSVSATAVLTALSVEDRPASRSCRAASRAPALRTAGSGVSGSVRVLEPVSQSFGSHLPSPAVFIKCVGAAPRSALCRGVGGFRTMCPLMVWTAHPRVPVLSLRTSTLLPGVSCWEAPLPRPWAGCGDLAGKGLSGRCPGPGRAQ